MHNKNVHFNYLLRWTRGNGSFFMSRKTFINKVRQNEEKTLEYISLNSIQHYSDCEPLVSGLGYILVDLKIIPAKTTVKISAVIASKDVTKDIGVEDCSKVHHALLPRLEALLKTDDTYMEVTSPGMDRNLKNAAEFEIFKGREVRVWDKTLNDWISGVITFADSKSVTLENSETKEKVSVNFENIAKAKFIHI